MRVILLDSRYLPVRFPFAAEGSPFLLPVVERTLLEHTVGWLRSYGLQDIHLVMDRGLDGDPAGVGHADSLGVRPAGSMRQALLAPGGANTGLRGGEPPPMPLLLLRANLFGLPDLVDVIRSHQARGGAAAVLRGSYRFGPGQYAFGPPVMALCAAFFARILARIDPAEPLKDVERYARGQGLAVTTVHSDAPVLEVNNAFALMSANLEHLPRIRAQAGKGPVREVGPQVFAAPGVRVDGARFDTSGGLIYLGSRSEVAPGGTVMGPALVGDRVRVGEGAVVRRSLLLADTVIPGGTLVNRRVVSPRFSCCADSRAAT